MIYGRLVDLVDNCDFFTEELRKNLKVLQELDFSKYAAGRHEVDEETFFFLNEYETKDAEQCFWEAHQKYLDIHYILEGHEKIAVDHIENQQVKEAYNTDSDATFFEGDIDSIIMMNPGDCMICFPEDSHMTGIIAEQKQEIRKVVFKVQINEKN